MTSVNFDIQKSIREAFGSALAELGKQNPNVVVLDADLSCSTQTKLFAQNFPDRFYNCGIAEQNMMTTATGLSLTGKIPFVATFAVFATGRTYDQIRNSICYQKANVKIIGTHCGVTVGEDGASHQALEDISLMRGLPNMTVITPADCEECRQAVFYASQIDGPVYIRLSRLSLPDIHDENYVFNPQKAEILQKGTDISIISNGDILQEVIKAGEMLKKNGIDAEIINMPVIKPLDTETIINTAQKTGYVVTVENHSVIGGLGSAVCEVLSKENPTFVQRIGIEDVFGQSGNPKELLKYYELDAEGIFKRIVNKK